jgi:hypothetical protein
MESKIENRFKEVLSLSEKKFKEDDLVLQFEKSINEFKKLVSIGVIQERGNNLLSISDSQSVSRIVFNAL